MNVLEHTARWTNNIIIVNKWTNIVLYKGYSNVINLLCIRNIVEPKLTKPCGKLKVIK